MSRDFKIGMSEFSLNRVTVVSRFYLDCNFSCALRVTVLTTMFCCALSSNNAKSEDLAAQLASQITLDRLISVVCGFKRNQEINYDLIEKRVRANRPEDYAVGVDRAERAMTEISEKMRSNEINCAALKDTFDGAEKVLLILQKRLDKKEN